MLSCKHATTAEGIFVQLGYDSDSHTAALP
jgi:hypothetical protein